MVEMSEKTHYRRAFNSPYLSSSDIVGPTVLTIAYVKLEKDATKKTKDMFNTAYFVEKEIRKDEKLKPMILNATNSRTLKNLTGSPYIDDWLNVPVTVYVDNNVKMMGSIVEGLRISTEAPIVKKELTPDNKTMWTNAVSAYKRDGNFLKVESRVFISEENKSQIIQEANNT